MALGDESCARFERRAWRACPASPSISAAAKQMKMSYRRAWTLVQDMNEAAGTALVQATTGGVTSPAGVSIFVGR